MKGTHLTVTVTVNPNPNQGRDGSRTPPQGGRGRASSKSPARDRAPAAAPFQAAERKPKGRGGVVLSEDPPIGASPGELRVWKVERGLMDPPARVAPGAKAAGSGYAAARGRS